jgi:membrane protein implicated in regulation of membrane protease activity
MSRRRLLHTLNQTFWVLVLGVICLFAFFLITGAISPTGAVGLSIAVLVLVVLWLGHAMWQARHRTGRDEAAVRARERRGF